MHHKLMHIKISKPLIYTVKMLFLIHFLQLSHSLIIEKIPNHKTPPSSTYYSSSVYDPINNQIISIGGVDSYANTQVPKIWSYNLDSNEFRKIEKLSDYEPAEYAYHATYLRNDRKILVFGYSSGISSFNLINSAWSYEITLGDQIPDLSIFAHTTFKYNETEFVAIFGGFSELGAQDVLYL